MTRKTAPLTTLEDVFATYRTDDVAAVLDAVRTTGQSAAPKPTQYVSNLVYAVAITRGVNPKQLQDAVERYSEALDALSSR